MNQITLEDTLGSLQENQFAVELPTEITLKAARAAERMIAIG